MELRQITYFLAISETKNFTRAAEKLFISQPALTNQMNALESELGMRLFNRSNKAVTLTPAGEIFHLHALQVISEVNSTLLHVKGIQEEAQKNISYLISPFFTDCCIKDIYETISSLLPDNHCFFSIMGNEQMKQSFSNPQFSFGITLESVSSQMPNAHSIAKSPVVFASATEEALSNPAAVYLIPGDAGSLTLDIRSILPPAAKPAYVCTQNHMMLYEHLTECIFVFPKAIVPKHFAVKETTLYSAVTLFGPDEDTKKLLKPGLCSYFIKNDWEEIRL